MSLLLRVTPENVTTLPGYSFTRATTATYTDENGVIQTAASGELRNSHYIDGERTILLEPASTNVLHNSFSPATQSRTLGAGTWTLSIKGSGSVNADGATDGDYGDATEGTGNHLTFTVSTSQSVTFTVTGTVTHFQAEEQDFPTSFIETAAGSATRNADELSVDWPHDPQEMTGYADCYDLDGTTSTRKVFQIGTAPPRFSIQSYSFRAFYEDGTNADDAFVAGATPDYGDRTEFAAQLSSAGTPTLLYSENGGTVFSGTDSTPNASLQPAWGASTIYIGDNHVGTTTHSFALKRLTFVTGVQSMDAMRSGIYTFSREWRLRIHDAGTTTPSDGTVAYTFDAEIAEPPEVGSQSVRILDGRSESNPWRVKLVDSSSAVTSVLGDANDRAQLGQRIADIGKRDDGGSWDTLATGRIDGISLDNFAGYVVSIADERIVERNSTLFAGTGGTTSIYWAGFTAGNYGPFTSPDLEFFGGGDTPRVYFERVNHSGDSTEVVLRPYHAPVSGTSGLLDLIVDDVKADVDAVVVSSSATEGSYRNLRLRLDDEGSDREVIGFAGLSFTVTGADGRPTQMKRLDIYDPSNDLASGYGYLYMPTADPSDAVPLHIEARPGDLLKDIYDGTYSDAAVRYDATAMTALQNRLQADGVGSLRWRITGTANMARWVEDNFYKPLGVVPLIDADGKVKPVKVYPTESDITNTVELHEFTESNCKLLDWRYAPDEMVTIVRGKYKREIVEAYENYGELYEPGRSLDGLKVTDYEHEEAHDTAGDSDRVLEFDLRGWHDKDAVEDFLSLRAREVFEMFGDGPLYVTVKGFAASETVAAGDYVLVNHSALPAPTGNRGDSRICFVLSRTATANGFVFDLIEVGPKLQPLSAPSISVAQNGNGADVTVSSLATDARWELRMHDGDSASAPADSDTGWRSVAVIPNGTSSYTIPRVKAGVTIWFQARARKEGRIPSDWSTAQSLSITALTAPSGLAVSDQGAVYVVATFTAGESDLETQVYLEGTLRTILPAGSTRVKILGLTTSTTYNSPGLQVRHLDRQTGATSAFDTVTFTTNATAETAPAYEAARLIVGESG